MFSEFEVVYENGVLRPDAALPLPEHTRLLIAVRARVPNRESRENAMDELRALAESGQFRMNGWRPTRDELYERD